MYKLYLSNVDSTISLETVVDFVTFYSECYQLAISTLSFYSPVSATTKPGVKNAVATSETALIVEGIVGSEDSQEAAVLYLGQQLIGGLPVVASAVKPSALNDTKYKLFAVSEAKQIKYLDSPGTAQPAEPPTAGVLASTARLLAKSDNDIKEDIYNAQREYQQMRTDFVQDLKQTYSSPKKLGGATATPPSTPPGVHREDSSDGLSVVDLAEKKSIAQHLAESIIQREDPMRASVISIQAVSDSGSLGFALPPAAGPANAPAVPLATAAQFQQDMMKSVLDMNYFDPQRMLFARKQPTADGKAAHAPAGPAFVIPPRQQGVSAPPTHEKVAASSVLASTSRNFFWNFGRNVDNLVEQIANHGDETEDYVKYFQEKVKTKFRKTIASALRKGIDSAIDKIGAEFTTVCGSLPSFHPTKIPVIQWAWSVFDVLLCRAWSHSETQYISGERDIVHTLAVVAKLTQVNLGFHRLLADYETVTARWAPNARNGGVASLMEFLVEPETTQPHDEAKQFIEAKLIERFFANAFGENVSEVKTMVDLANRVALLNSLVSYNLQFYQFKRFLVLQQRSHLFNVFVHASLAEENVAAISADLKQLKSTFKAKVCSVM